MFFAAHYVPETDKKSVESTSERCFSGVYFDRVCRIGALLRHEPEEEITH